MIRFFASFARKPVAELLHTQQTHIIAIMGGVLIGLFEAPYAIIIEQQSHESALANIVGESGSSLVAFL